VSEETPGIAAWAVRELQTAKGRAGLFYVLPGPNAFGAGALAPEAPSLEALLPSIEAGDLRGLVVCESDPLATEADPNRVAAALRTLECLLVLDYLPTPTVEAASLFLPTQNVFEAGGSYRNQTGRVQHAAPVYLGGTPIAQTGNGGHPPREFRRDIPGGEPKPAWEVLRELGRRLAPGGP
jgi:NADH-quinone oxidoreductase subunit G